MAARVEFAHEAVAVNGIELHCATCGMREAPLIIFLHGFPEYWAGWARVMPHFADRYFCVAPDQRGYNLSSSPAGVESYAVKHLVEDIRQLADHFSPGKRFVLAGHDWGASVAYAFAMFHPARLDRLVIANGVHPVPFQTALLTDDAQIEASQYFHLLRSPKAERVLSDDGFARLLKMLTGFSNVAFLDDKAREGYIAAWSQPGALTGMVNWYRASPIYVPEAGTTPDPALALKADPERMKIRMPHLLLHGVADRALRPASFEGLEAFAPRLDVVRFEDAGHWILHEKPGQVADAIGRWLSA